MSETIAFLQIEGWHILYTDSRESHAPALHSQPALLCIHGAGCTHLSWPPTLRALASQRVLTLDLPGHGDSTGPGRTTVAAYAEEIIKFVDALGLASVVVAGHSMGGAVALDLALRPLPWLTGLVLVGTGACLPVADALLDGLQHDFAATTARIGRWLWGPTAPPLRPQLSVDTLRRQGAQVVRNDFLACHAFDVRAQLHTIKTPTLILGGGQDRMTPLAYSQFMAEKISHAHLEQVPNAGHMMALEYPTLVTNTIQHFTHSTHQRAQS